MNADGRGEATRIDLESWERRELFRFFDGYSEPFHGVCVRVDCTESFRYAKDHHLSVFLTLLHRNLLAAHGVENLMMRSVHGEVWRYPTILGGSAVGRANGTIGFAYFRFHEGLQEFVREAAIEVNRVKASDALERYPGQDLIRYSVLPWLDFTSLSHARDFKERLDTADHVWEDHRSEWPMDDACVHPRAPWAGGWGASGALCGAV